MSIRRLVPAAAGLAVAFMVAPMNVLHSQGQPGQDSAAQRTWGHNPGPITRPSQVPTQAQAGVRADTGFIREATSGNLLEVRLGTLAQQKATNAAVKQFAQRMVTDHGAMQNQWATLMSRNGLPLRATLDVTQQQEVNQLERLSGAEFDRAYMTAMIQDHQRDAEAFQTLGPTAQSPEVRQLAATGLTTIREHLSMAQQVGSQIGVTNVAAAPPVPGESGQVVTQPGQVGRTGQPRRGGGGRNDVNADREFIRDVTAAAVMEIRMGELAQKRSKDDAVKRLADRMLSDFTKLQDRWTGMASRNGMPFQPGMGDLHRQKVERLEKVKGAKFDRAYVAAVIQNHDALLPYFEKEGRSAHSPQVRNLVNEELPILRQHLSMAKRIGGQIHADTTVSRDERGVSSKR